jgi:POT family proton-dependent oligopeptide transporter
MGTALGTLLAGLMGGQFEALPLPKLFGVVSLVAGPVGVLFLLFSGPIRKWMGQVR